MKLCPVCGSSNTDYLTWYDGICCVDCGYDEEEEKGGTMTKKDYERAASILAEQQLYYTLPTDWAGVVRLFTRFFIDNPRFDVKKFQDRITQRVAANSPFGGISRSVKRRLKIQLAEKKEE